MSALNESRAWEGATNGRAVAGPMSSEPWSYVTAENSAGRSLHRDYLDAMNADLDEIDAYCNEVDATAERGGSPLVTAASLFVGAGFLLMVALTFWGWLG